MRPTLTGLALCACLAPTLQAADPPTPTASYELHFQSHWTAANHPDDWPGASAHFSSLIGATHDGDVSLWEPGGIATSGIESMAETGATSLLTSEINGLIAAGDAGERITGPALFGIGASVSTDFDIDLDHPLVSVVTMIAPSPDWFIGTHGLSLLQDGQWVAELEVELLAYDAGTDSGVTFNSPNADVTPHEPITLLSGSAPFEDNLTPLGTFTFTRTDLPQAWADLGQGLAGTLPAPALVGDGALVGGNDLSLDVTGALPSAPLGLVLGFSVLEAPFKGGVLVPAADLVVLGLLTDGAGAFGLATTWPDGLAGGGQLVVQAWVQDAGGPVGWSATNGVCTPVY